jgi:TrmH family RNA methyltransferase
MRLKKYARDDSHAYTFGLFPTLELLRFQPAQVSEVLLHSSGERSEGIAKLRTQCQQMHIPVEINDKLIERIAPKDNTYAVGVFRKYQPQLEARANHLALVNPADMGNLGTTIRTLLGFGLTNLALIKPAADIFDPRAIRASMGALFQLTFAYFDSFEAYRAVFTRHHLYPFMTDGQTTIRTARFESPFVLIFGSESSGLPPHYHQLGTSVSIPHADAIDSLNLSVAIGIAVYQATHADFSDG